MYKRRYGAVVPYGRRRATTYGRKKKYVMYRRPASSAGFKAKVQRAVGAELKYLAVNATYQASQDQANAYVRFGAIGQGLGQSQRIGNWITPKFMHGTVRVRGNPLALEDGAEPAHLTWTIRIGILVYLDSRQGASDLTSDLLQDSARPGGPFKVALKGEFRVLWSRITVVSNNNDNDYFTRTFKYSLKLASLGKALYEGSDAEDQTRGQLLFFAMSDASSPPAFPPFIDMDGMFRYTDA